MTALTMPAPPGQDTALRPVPWRRMAWVTWRQHRPTLAGVPAILWARWPCTCWLAGLQIHHAYAVLTACHPVSSTRLRASTSAAVHGTDRTIVVTVISAGWCRR